MSPAYAVICYRRGQVRFTAADGTCQYYPTLRNFRKFTYLVQRQLKKLLRNDIIVAPGRLKIIEGELGEAAQVAQGLQTGCPPVVNLFSAAIAGFQAAVIRFTRCKQRVYKPGPVAYCTIVDRPLTGNGPLQPIAGPCARIFPGCIYRDLFLAENLRQVFHLFFLLFPNVLIYCEYISSSAH